MDTSINRLAARANAGSFSATTPEDYADGAPQIKHAALRNLYRKLAASVYDSACATCAQPTLLDLGAGEGSMTLPFLEFGARVAAVDISERRLGTLQTRCAKYKGNLELICDDALSAIAQTRQKGKRFNIVMMNSFMHHVPDYIGLIREAITVLSSDGQLFSYQDPMRYDSLGWCSSMFSKIAYVSWRISKGDVIAGMQRRLRRARGVFMPDSPADLVDYHGVRNGVDQEAICRLLESNGFVCEIIRYFSTQSSAWQPFGTALGIENTFAVVARRKT